MGTYTRLRPGGTTVATDGALRHGMLASTWLCDAGGWGVSRSEYHRRGNHGHGVAVAELMAIRLAHLHHPDVPVRVLTDSKDAARWVGQWLNRQGIDLPYEWGVYRVPLVAFARNVAHRVRPLTIEWTAGHTGHPLNEGADALAALAARMSHDGVTVDQLRHRAGDIADQFAAAYRATRTEEEAPCP